MSHRSLLDYLEEAAAGERAARAAETRSQSLEQQLAEMEARLAALRNETVPPAPVDETDQALTSRIEAILKRRQAIENAVHRHDDRDYHGRRTMQSPPLAYDGAPGAHDRQDFRSFAETVHAIGQAARRFLEPETASHSTYAAHDEAASLVAALRQAIAAFQNASAELAATAANLRDVRAPRFSDRDEAYAPRRPGREDPELIRILDDVEDLRGRLARLTHHRSRQAY